MTSPKLFRMLKLLAPGVLALACGSRVLGFGGHPLPPGPPGPPQIPVEIPAQPGDAGGVAAGSPSEDEVQIPAILLQPDKNDVTEPIFDAGGDVASPSPPDTNPNSTPEPATLLMGLVGAGALGAAGLWNRRRLSLAK